MNILILGSGGREHAIARSLRSDDDVLYIAPGNPGMAPLGTLVDLDILDGAAVAAFARSKGIDLVVVGPEAPLVAGVADAVREAGIDVFGPSREAARLEGSKAFAKEVMASAGVQTARSRLCTSLGEVEAALDAFGAPHVVKDDGLAAGKGVVVTDDRDAALAHAQGCLAKPEGKALIEEFLDGPEVSLFCLCDGRVALPLEPAQDYKRAYDGGKGPNTGGMGSYSPLPWADPGLADAVVAACREQGPGILPWEGGAAGLRARLALLHRELGEPWPAMDDDSLLARAGDWLAPAVEQLAARSRRFDLGALDLTTALRALLPWPQAARLDELVPERIEVPSGSRVRVEYGACGERPVLAVRVQECFGWEETPRVVDGRVPVLLHLLSPARRPVAVTDDLRSFWAGPYQQVRREMRGRYPKHAWPEDPRRPGRPEGSSPTRCGPRPSV